MRNQVGATCYAMKLLDHWCAQVLALSVIAKSHPQAPYACFVSGLLHKLNYFIRIFPELHHHLDSFGVVIYLSSFQPSQKVTTGTRKL